jgi:hypothetical protein
MVQSITVPANEYTQDLLNVITEPNAFRSIMLLILSLVIAYWLSHFLASGIIRFAQVVSNRSDKETNEQRALRYRQIETYLSILVAVVRAVVVMLAGFIAWRTLSPMSNTSAAAIGAGAFFIVFAGQTLGIILRDLTAGTTMIAERWFNVGDFIKVEPYWDVSGVVERFTLRSTRIRSLSGEVIWIHNQHITGVHVTPRGLRTMAVDIFVRDRDRGIAEVQHIIDAIPKGKTMLARPLKITVEEKWSEDLYHFVVTGQTPPGREWLIQDYFIDAIKGIDDGKPKSKQLIAHAPMARFADDIADKRFRRAVRVAKDKKPEDL